MTETARAGHGKKSTQKWNVEGWGEQDNCITENMIVEGRIEGRNPDPLCFIFLFLCRYIPISNIQTAEL